MIRPTHTYCDDNHDVLVTLPVQYEIDNSQYYMRNAPRVAQFIQHDRELIDNSIYNQPSLIVQLITEALALTTASYIAEPELFDIHEINQPLKTSRIKLRIRSVRQAELQHQLSDFAKWLLDGED